VLDASDGIEPSFFEVATASPSRLRPHARRRLHPRGRPRRPARRDQRHRAPLVTGIASLALDHQQFLGDAPAGHRRGKSRHRQSRACRSSPSSTRPRSPSRSARSREAGAPLAAARRRLGRDRRQGKLRYRDEQGALDLPLPRLPGRHQAMNAALAVAMLRHQMRCASPPSALSAAMGWADWPARLQHLAPGPLSAIAKSGSTAATTRRRRASRAWAAARHFTDGKPLHLSSRASRPRTRRACSSRSGRRGHVHTVPIPDHACFAPDELAEIAAELGLQGRPHSVSSSGAGRIPAGRARADLRLALPRRRSPRRQRSSPD
jgi:dihydrofolate synthase/folylpolyglutamate synthase